MNSRTAVVCSALLFALASLSNASWAQLEWQAEPNQNTLSRNPNQSQNSSNNIATKIQLGQTLEFLAVEQAYIVTPVFSHGKLSLQWTIADGYYLYQHKFKFTAQYPGQAPNQVLSTAYPKAKVIYDPTFEQDLEVYYHGVNLDLQGLEVNQNTLKLKVDFQGCADAGLCYPPSSYWFELDLEAQSYRAISAPAIATSNQPNPAADISLWLALVSALIGGLILNLMPCVFPVLSIKALSLAEAQQSSAQQHRHGWSYTLGAVLSFTGVAAVMLALKAGGQAIGWGFQLQSPIFVSLLVYLFFAMGLSLSGLAEFGTRLMGVGNNLSLKSGYRGSFYTGVLASVVASPCTAPFMGTALGFALGQPAVIALLVFATLGFGMALPFLLLSYWPGLSEKLPKPGPWMETLKQALAFPLYLAAIWLIWVLGRQSGSDAMAIILTGLMLITFALWLLHKYQKNSARILALLAVAAALALPAIAASLSSQNPKELNGPWQNYSKAKLEQALAQDRSVFINVTAAWCLSCLANERIAFGDAFEQQLKQQNTLALKADWTQYNPAITELLKQYGRNGVPLYVFIDQGKNQILPQLLTESSLLKATKIQSPAK